MQTLYLDKRDWLQVVVTPRRRLVAGVVLLLLFFLPLWHESVEGRFLLEPVSRSTLRAEVPGYVEVVHVQEGQQVPAGTVLIGLRNLELETKAARAEADSQTASARMIQAQMKWQDFARARGEHQRYQEESRGLAAQVSRLSVRSPLSGTVVTPRVQDWLGSYVAAGTELVEVADTLRMRARIYVAESDTKKAHVGASARVLCDSFVQPVSGTVTSRAPAAYEIEPGLVAVSNFKGAHLPNFFVYEIVLENPSGEFQSGMAGSAKIFGRRRSMAGLLWEPIGNFLGRKVW
jgi:multidrug resistance efflux pump